MKDFKIIPVLDLLNGIAVHAIKGERESYKPLKSSYFKSSHPIDILETISLWNDFTYLYIADLDAILKQQPNFNLLRTIINKYDFTLIVDPGIISLDDVLKFSSSGFEKLILGLETLNNLDIILGSIDILGFDNFYVSLDMFQKKVITNINEFKDHSVIYVAKKLEAIGIQKIILLDLFRVGQKLGGIPPIYNEIRHIYQGEILVGGGIKNINDVRMYYSNGFSGVLIGTALYDGTINIQKLRKLINKYDSRS